MLPAATHLAPHYSEVHQHARGVTHTPPCLGSSCMLPAATHLAPHYSEVHQHARGVTHTPPCFVAALGCHGGHENPPWYPLCSTQYRRSQVDPDLLFHWPRNVSSSGFGPAKKIEGMLKDDTGFFYKYANTVRNCHPLTARDCIRLSE